MFCKGAILLCISCVCFADLSIEKKDTLLNGFIEYYNNLPNQIYTCEEGSVQNAQQTDENCYKIDANIKVVEKNNLNSHKFLKCTASLSDVEESVTVLNNEYQCQDELSNLEEIVSEVPSSSSTTTEAPIVYSPVQLDNEVQTNVGVTSGEQFIAIPRERPTAACIGCASHVDPQAPGVNDLATIGVRQLDRHEPNVRHSLRGVVEVERQVQVVNGVRFILTVLVDYNSCTATVTESCETTKACKITILEKPWIRFADGSKQRAIMANNCTDEWRFGDEGEVITQNTSNNKENNEIDVSLKPNPGPDDGIIKASHNTEVQTSQQLEKTLTNEEVKHLEKQIIPHDRFVEMSTQKLNVPASSSDNNLPESKEHVVKVETAKHYSDNSIPVNQLEKHETVPLLTEDKKKAIDDMLNFFDFAGIRSKPNDKEEFPRMKRSYKYDLQVMSLAERFNKIKNNLEHAKKLREMAETIVDYVNEIDMQVKTRVLKDVINVEEEIENHQHFYYIQSRISIPCDKVECDDNDKLTEICNGVIDNTDEKKNQVLNAFCHSEAKTRSSLANINRIPPDDQVLQSLLKKVVKKIESESKLQSAMAINKVVDATTQRASGTVTKISIVFDYTNCSKTVHYELRKNENCTVLKHLGSNLCEVIIHERSWLNDKEITYSCTERSFDGIFSLKEKVRNINESIADPKVRDMIQEALQNLEVQSNRNNKQKIVQVKSVSSKLIAGFLTNIEFIVGYTECASDSKIDEDSCNLLKNEPLRNCRAEIWDRTWIEEGRQVEVSCKEEESYNKNKIDQKFRKKRSLNFVGGQSVKDTNNPRYRSLADESLRQYIQSSGNSKNYSVIRIKNVTVQIVAGSLTRINFTITPIVCRTPKEEGAFMNGCEILNYEDIIDCFSTIWEQPWLNLKTINVTCNETPKKTRALLGGSKDENPSNPHYKKLAELSMQKYLQTIDDTQDHEVVTVERVTTQIVSGKLVSIDFTISPTRQKSSDVIRCHSEVWEQPWLNRTEVRKVNCHNYIESDSIVTKLPGGSEEDNPSNPHYKELAELSMQNYLKTNGNTQEHKVVNVINVRTQVVAGKLVTIDFTISPTHGSSGDIISCHSEVWEKPWLKWTEVQSVNCHINIANDGKKTGFPGGFKEDDPSNPHYKKLAELSMQKYLQTIDDPQDHEVVTIEKVTTQIVSGKLVIIDFLISPTSQTSGDVISCRSEVWEQSWLNKTEVKKVNCHNNIENNNKKAGLPGGFTGDDPSNPHFKELAELSMQKYLQKSGNTREHKVVNILNVTTQVVAGKLVKIDFTISPTVGSSGDIISCHSEVWEKPWLKWTEVQTVNCHINIANDGLKTGFPGGFKEDDPSNPHYKKLAELSMRIYLKTSGNIREHEVVNVKNVTTQVIAGKLVKIDFTISPTVESSGDIISCHSEVWEKPWLKWTEVQLVNCDINIEDDDIKTGLPGGFEEDDPTNPHYKMLAELSMKNYLKTSGNTQEHNVVNIINVTTQIVSGKLITIDFTIAPTPQTSGDIISCHSEVWEQPWLNKTEVKKVNCHVNTENYSLKTRLPGGFAEGDPSNPHFKILAELSMQEYLQKSGNTREHKVINVINVTTQVVAGKLVKIDFTISPTHGSSGDIISCHSEVWEQLWLNKTEVQSVNCHVNIANDAIKTALPGGFKEDDRSNPHYKKLAELSMRIYLKTSGNIREHKVVNVKNVTTQVVAGKLVKIDFTISPTVESSGDIISCHSEVWEKPWLKWTEVQSVNCHNSIEDDINTGLPGGFEEDDPSNPHYKKLAELSMQNYLKTSGNTQEHKVVHVINVRTQVVAGKLVTIDFTMSPTVGSSGDIISCQSEVWEKPWLNWTEVQSVNCHINIDDMKTGLLGGVEEDDPSNPHFKELAELSMQQYLQKSGDTRDHKVVNVINVTTQVVAGKLVKIDFTISPTVGSSGEIISCQSEVWEKPWLKWTEVQSVNCHINIENDDINTGLPGGFEEDDPSNPHYKKLAELSMQNYLKTSGNTQEHKVVNVINVRTQVVAGKLVTIDFTMSPTVGSSGDIISCQSEVWEKPWLNWTEVQSVNCHINIDDMKTGLLGGVEEDDPSNPHFKELAELSMQQYLQKSGDTRDHKVVNVINVTTQVVAGKLVKIDFTISPTVGSSGEIISCQSEVWEKPWLKWTEVQSVNCHINIKNDDINTGLPGGFEEDDPTNPHYKKLAELSMQNYLKTSGNTREHKVVNVINVETQIVSGKLVIIDFIISPTSQTSGDVISCHSEVWEQPWLNKTEVKTVNCHNNIENNNKKAGLPGGFTGDDPSNPHFKELAELSMQKYLQQSGNTREHKVINVLNVKTQVVAGKLVKIDFTMSPTVGTSGDIISCHSEVWEKPWLKWTEVQSVNCHINIEDDGKKTGLPGGVEEDDPSNPHFKELAELSMHKYLQKSGNTREHKVVNVLNVRTQVVAGKLVKIDFTISPTVGSSGDIISCHSEVWEKPWLKWTEVQSVNCHINNGSYRKKRGLIQVNSQTSLKGGEQVKLNPNIREYKLLAEQSLREYQRLQKSDVHHKVIEVNRVVTQVVSGMKYKIDFSAKPMTCSAKVVKPSKCKIDNGSLILYCHSDIWDRPWLKLKKIEVSCNTGDDEDTGVRSKRSLHHTIGLLTKMDVNKEEYKMLAEEALRKYQELSRTQYVHKVLRIHTVQEQVVKGTLTKIAYSVSPTKCLIGEEKNSNCEIQLPKIELFCNADIWDRPWLNDKNINVNCERKNETKIAYDEQDEHKEKFVRVKRLVDPEDYDMDEEMTFYYADRAVQQINDAQGVTNLNKLITIHDIQSGIYMKTHMVRMYIETAPTYCLKGGDESDLLNCEELDGQNHRLCLAKIWPSPENEMVVKHVNVVCDDENNFESVTGLSVKELLRASLIELEKNPDTRYKLVHQGEPQIIPSLDSRVPITLNYIIATTNCTKDIDINKYRYQCYVDTTILSKACSSLIWLVPNSRTIKKIDVGCKTYENRAKRSVSLNPVNATTDELLIQKLVQESLYKLEMSSQHRYKQRLMQINSYSTKVTTGKLTTIDFDVGYTSCLKYEWVKSDTTCEFLVHLPRRHCVSKVWERLWLQNGRNIEVECEDDETPLEPHIEFESAEMAMQLAKEALKHIEAKYPNPRKQKVIRIFSLEKQVVAGIHYRLKVEVGLTKCLALSGETECNLDQDLDGNKFCRVNVWLRPWTDHPPNYRVTCDYQEGFTNDLYHHLQTEHLFQHFIATYKPDYLNDHKKLMTKFEIFKANVRKIHELNTHERGTATYGITRFADLSHDEFSSMYLGLKPSLRDANQVPMKKAVIPNIVPPEKFDWREFDAVTEVKDQGSCGSCWAFSVTGNIEGQWKMQSGDLVSLSEQELVDCDKLDQGCNGGLPDNAYRAIEQLGGLELENDYPYEGEDDKCTFNKTLSRVQISGAVNISSNETDMVKWLVDSGPISIGINANAMQFYMGGVSHPWKMLCSPTNLDHGVLIVGYGIKDYPLFHKRLPYWIIKNSWGKSWGEQGYYRVYRGDGTCGVNLMASSAVI